MSLCPYWECGFQGLYFGRECGIEEKETRVVRTDLSDFDVTSEHMMQVYDIHVRRQLECALVGSSEMWGWKGLMTSAPYMSCVRRILSTVSTGGSEACD